MSICTTTSGVYSSVLGAILGCTVAFERILRCFRGHNSLIVAHTAGRLLLDLATPLLLYC